MKNVAIVIEQEPRWKKESEIGIKRQEVLLGLYEGIPLTGRDSGYFGALPDKITIFQKPIEILSEGSEERVIALVREVVWHEIGHHFGLSDREISILEKREKRQKYNWYNIGSRVFSAEKSREPASHRRAPALRSSMCSLLTSAREMKARTLSFPSPQNKNRKEALQYLSLALRRQ